MKNFTGFSWVLISHDHEKKRSLSGRLLFVLVNVNFSHINLDTNNGGEVWARNKQF